MSARITEPGVYPDIPEREYHRDPVVGGSLSSSGARTLVDRTPAHFAHQREHPRADTTSFDIGRVTHGQVLGVGGELVEVHADDWRTKAAREERDAARADGNTPLLVHQADAVRVMVEAVRAHAIAGPLFARPGRAELTAVARDPDSGVMCRVRLDWLVDTEPGARLVAADLKSTENGSPFGPFARSAGSYGYFAQEPFYTDVLHWLGLTADADGELVEPLFTFVTVEKDPPHLVAVHRVLAEDRDRGRVVNRKARDLFRHGQATGEWPGYPDEVHDLALPGYFRAQHDAAAAAGRFDTEADELADQLADDLDVHDDPDVAPHQVADDDPPPDVATAASSGVERDQVWVHKRGVRRLTVTSVDGDRVGVRRSSSRRTQAVRLATLRKDYRLETTP